MADKRQLIILAHAAPAVPRFRVYMNIGSMIVLIPTDSITAYSALFISPSPLRIPDAPLENINVNSPANIMVL